MSRYCFEPLDTAHHKINRFESGNEHLDSIIRSGAEGYGKAYVIVSRRRSADVVAFVALLPEQQWVTGADAETGDWTFVCLNIMAVDSRYQGRGIGKWILTELVRDIVELSKSARLEYLVIVPIDDSSRLYYEHLKWKFETSPSGSLVLRVSVMREAVGNAARRDGLRLIR